MADAFEELRDELHALMMFKRQARELKLLNAGTNDPREHHWRFRTSSGEIITISIEKEPSDEG